MASVVVAGILPAECVMKEVARMLIQAGHSVSLHFGEAGLAGNPDWADAELLVTILCTCGGAEMQLAPQLRAIVSPLIGFDWIDVQAADAAGILVVNGLVEENQQSMAEATIMLALAALYDFQGTAASFWPNVPVDQPVRRMFRRKTLGMIGFGAIAQAIVDRLTGWEVDIQAFSRYTSHHSGVRFVELDALLASSDVIMVLTSLDDTSRHLLNSDRLSQVKQGAILINTSRGGVIDEAKLVEALKSGQISKAMLDVFEVEPLPSDSPLRALDNVVLTPHSVGHTVDTMEAMPRLAAQNALDLLAGTVPKGCRNPQSVEAWRLRQRLAGASVDAAAAR